MIRTSILFAVTVMLEPGNVLGFCVPTNFIVSHRGYSKTESLLGTVNPALSSLNSRSMEAKSNSILQIDEDDEDDEECIIQTENDERTRRGFIKNKNNSGPDKLANKNLRNKQKFLVRQQKELKKVESFLKFRRRRDNDARMSGYGRYNGAARSKQQSFTLKELLCIYDESLRNAQIDKHEKSLRGFLSTHVVTAFHHAKSSAVLTDMIDDFIAIKGKSNDGICHPPLSATLSGREETNLIRLLGVRGAYDAMLKYLQYLASDQYISISTDQLSGATVFSFTAAITALSQSSDQRYRRMAKQLLKQMEGLGVRPNSFTFTALFLSVDGGKQANEMMNIAKKSIVKDEIGVHLYNAAIYACSRGNSKGDTDWQTALSLFREMQKEGIERNEQTFASIIHVCAKNGQVRVAVSLLDEMKRNPSLGKPTQKVWGAVLRACANCGDFKKALQLLNEMRSNGIQANVLHYNSVLAALAKAGESDLALDLLNAMQNKTDDSNSLTAINNLSSDEIIMDQNIEIDLVSLNTVLRAYAHPKNADFDGAFNMLTQMKNGDFVTNIEGQNKIIHPDVISYNTVLSTCKNPKIALSLLTEVSI